MKIPEELSFTRRRRLPVVLAAEAAECGLACLTMVARFHGHDIDLNALRQRFALSLTGAGLGSLMTLAAALGLSPRALRVELPALKDVKRPAILHWDLNHFVVLAAVTAKTITIHDPALGKRTLPLAEFSKHFTGVVLELIPAADFAPVKARAPMKLSLPCGMVGESDSPVAAGRSADSSTPWPTRTAGSSARGIPWPARRSGLPRRYD